MAATIFSICDDRFAPALAALVNSLRAHGCDGEIVVGVPAPLETRDRFVGVEFVVMGESPYWIAHRKAELILRHGAESFVFYDADMILVDPSFPRRLADWVEIGPVFALEAMMAPSDYRRQMWRRRLGRTPGARSGSWEYFNGGFFAGHLARDGELLREWDRVAAEVLAPPSDMFQDEDFPMPNSGILNAILQDSDLQPVGVAHPDIWSQAIPVNPFFHVGGFAEPAVLHCTGKEKPWRFEEVPLRAPTRYDGAWFRHVVAHPSPVALEHPMSRQLRSWFQGELMGRTVAKAKHWRARIKP